MGKGREGKLSCEIVEKGSFGPPICRGGDTTDFGHTFSNRTYFRPCGWIWLRSVQLAQRLEGEKKERKNPSPPIRRLCRAGGLITGVQVLQQPFAQCFVVPDQLHDWHQ